MKKIPQEKLFLSGMDARAPQLARERGLGLELTLFSYAPNLEDAAQLAAAREQMQGISRFWLHAPFAELAPCAIDPMVRQVVLTRFRGRAAARRYPYRGTRRLPAARLFPGVVCGAERGILEGIFARGAAEYDTCAGKRDGAFAGDARRDRPAGGRPTAGAVPRRRAREHLRQQPPAVSVARAHGAVAAASACA